MSVLSNRWLRATASLVATAAGVALTAAPATASTQSVAVVGYSVVGPAYTALENAFEATSAGQGVSFTNSFGASDTETTNVANGQAADIVNLSYEPNVATLVTDGKVPANWATQEKTIAGVNVAAKGKRQQTVYPTPGIVTDSTVVIIVRSGNPLDITNWSSLVKTGVQIVTPNPATSGSATWNLLAAYESQIIQKKTPDQAQTFLKKIIENTVSQPTSGSAAMAAFVAGTGNVLLDYEDDAIAAQAKGDPIQIIVPPQTLLIENPIALTNTGVSNPAAVSFYKYVFSAAGQGILASLGYRSVLTNVWKASDKNFPSFQAKTKLATVEQMAKGGWSTVYPEFFSPTVAFPKKSTTYPDQGIVTYLEQFAGQTA